MDESDQDAAEGRLRSLERQLAQAARKEIDIERESQDALAEAAEFRHAALLREQKLAVEVEQIRHEKEAVSQELKVAQNAASNLSMSTEVHDQALQQKQAEVQTVRETNRLLDLKLQQLQSQLQEQVASNKQARDTVMTLTKERGDLDMKRMHSENELRQCQHAKQSLEMEKDILQKDVALLHTQLDDKSESLRQSWSAANAKAHDLEQQLHDAHSQQQALSASNKQLEQQKDRLDGQLHKAQKECQDARTQLQDSKAAFEEENTSLHSLASRHKEERVSLENDKQALDGLVRELAQKAEAFKAEQQQVAAQLQQRLDVAEQACHERDQTIERFKQAMGDSQEPAFLQSQHTLGNGHSNTAALPEQSQLSPVQSYSMYVSLVHEHNQLKQDHAKLQAEWEQFETAVIPEAQRAQQLAKRNVNLDEANAKLSAQVQVSNEKAKRCVDSALKWQGQFDDEKSAHGVTRKLLKEAQHQVVLLANENRQLNGVRERAVMPAWSSATLGANLVEFKDTQDIVSKNEALRRLVHELQLKTDQQLKQRHSEACEREQQIMKSYESSLAAARQQNTDAMTQVQHMMQQRDAAQQAAKTAAEKQGSGPDAQSGPGPRQQQRRVGELEKELARLRQDGQAYRDDLRQQLEGAKQTATQARHEAAQSNALAGHEAKLVQQLQDDKARMADIVDNWKRQGREQQALISSLNRRLDQLHSQASKAQDEVGQLRQKVAVLEAQKELLHKDSQRLLHESTEHASARWRLAAERDTELRLSSQQHEADTKERQQLHAELSSLQRELAECQRQLTEERSSHQHSFSAQESADVRLTEIKEARDKLQESLSKAEKQLATSEAKSAFRQTNVEKAEERAAALDLKLKAKASFVSGAASSSKETELSQSMASLQKELQEAQQQAAQEASHVAQFRSLAEGAEENTKIVQGQVDTLKAEATQSVEQLQQVKAKLQAAEKDLNAARQSAYQDAQAASKDKQQAHTQITNLQAELVIAQRHAHTESERHQKVIADLTTSTNELKQAQSSYNQSVLDHADTVKKLSQEEVRVSNMEQERAAHETAVELAHRGKAAADLAWQQERNRLQTVIQAAQQRLRDLEKVNAELQVHLDNHARAAAGQAPVEGGQLPGLVQYLQKRLRTLEGENTGLEQTVARLKTDLDATSKRATQADQARLETAEKLRDSLRSQQDQERLMQEVQQSNLLRESNTTLRSMSEQYRKEAEVHRRRADQAEAQNEPVKRRISELQAVVDSHPGQVQILEEEVRNANQRIVHLLHKDDAVDKPEYERVAAALTAAQDKLTSLQADVNRLQPLADQAESCKARVESLEAEAGSLQATIDRQKSKESQAAQMLKKYNPEGLKISDWKVMMEQNRDRLKELEQVHASTEASNGQLTKELASAQAETSKLRQDATATGATNQGQQKQQQAELATLQSAEKKLQLQTKALTLELEQKNSRLEEMSTGKQQLEEQLAQANTDLSTSRAQLDSITADLKAAAAQVIIAQASLSAQAAAKNVPEVAAVQDGAVAPQQAAATTSNGEQLAQREAAIQQAETALHSQQQQLAHDKEQLQEQQQSLTASREQLTDDLRRLEQQKTACIQEALQLREQNAELQKQQGASAQASQQQGEQQEASAAQVHQLQKQVVDLEKSVAELEKAVKLKQNTVTRHQRNAADLKEKLDTRILILHKATCNARAKQAVNVAFETRIKEMAEQLRQAGLSVREEINSKTMFDDAYKKCMEEKSKGSANDAKAAPKPPPAARAAVATATIPAQSNAAASAAAPVSPSAGPTGGEAVSTGTNEIDAMRNAALALHKQGPAGAGVTQAAGLSLPQVVPTLKLREPGLQQGGKRERDESPSAAITYGAPASSNPPPAKRIRAPTPVGAIPLGMNQQPAVAPPAAVVAMHVQQPEEGPAVLLAGNQVTHAAPPVSGQADQAPAPAASQEHVATVAIVQQDPEHVQVKIELPATLVRTDAPSQQQTGTQPAPVEGVDQAGSATASDVHMPEAAGTSSVPETGKPVTTAEDAEDGELPDAANEQSATGSEAQSAQDPSPSTAAGLIDGSDADGAGAGGRRPRPIVFNLPPPEPVQPPEESAPITGSQPRGDRTPAPSTRGAHGKRGGTAAGRSLHSAARGKQARGRH